MCSARNRLLWKGFGRRVVLPIPSFIPPFTVCDGWTQWEAPDRCRSGTGSGDLGVMAPA